MITHFLAFAAGAGAVIGHAYWINRRQAQPDPEGPSRVERLETALAEARTHLSHIRSRKEEPMAARIASAGLRKVSRTLGEIDPVEKYTTNLRKVNSHGTSR